MGDFNKDLAALKEYLYHTSVFQDYFSLKAEYETSEELAKMRHDIARATAVDPDNPNAFILREKYEMHPIIQDYNQAKEEVDSLLEEIKSILEGD